MVFNCVLRSCRRMYHHEESVVDKRMKQPCPRQHPDAPSTSLTRTCGSFCFHLRVHVRMHASHVRSVHRQRTYTALLRKRTRGGASNTRTAPGLRQARNCLRLRFPLGSNLDQFSTPLLTMDGAW